MHGESNRSSIESHNTHYHTNHRFSIFKKKSFIIKKSDFLFFHLLHTLRAPKRTTMAMIIYDDGMINSSTIIMFGQAHRCSLSLSLYFARSNFVHPPLFSNSDNHNITNIERITKVFLFPFSKKKIDKENVFHVDCICFFTPVLSMYDIIEDRVINVGMY